MTVAQTLYREQREILTDGYEIERLILLEESVIDPKLFDELIEHYPDLTLEKLARNPNLTVEQQIALGKEGNIHAKRTLYANSPYPEVWEQAFSGGLHLFLLAQNPHLNLETEMRLVKEGSVAVHIHLGTYSKFKEVQLALSARADESINESLADNLAIHPEVALKVSFSKDKHVRETLTSNRRALEALTPGFSGRWVMTNLNEYQRSKVSADKKSLAERGVDSRVLEILKDTWEGDLETLIQSAVTLSA